jgi:hypothetical protein
MMIGDTPPSSLVTGLSSSALPAALRLLPSGPGPKRIASYVAALPVRWTWATAGWWARYSSGHDPEQSGADQGSEGGGVDVLHLDHHRVELEQHGPVRGHQLVQDVQRGD